MICVDINDQRESLAYAFAVSKIPSKHMLLAINSHPRLKERFSPRGRHWIAERAILLRKDEHQTLLREDGKWARSIRDEIWRERRDR